MNKTSENTVECGHTLTLIPVQLCVPRSRIAALYGSSVCDSLRDYMFFSKSGTILHAHQQDMQDLVSTSLPPLVIICLFIMPILKYR